MSIKDAIGQWETVSKNLHFDKSGYLKHISMLATSLLVILVSLRTGEMQSAHSVVSYGITLALSPLCVLSGLAGLFGSLHTQARLERALRSEVRRLLSGDDPLQRVISVRPYRIYALSEIICYISFVLCVLSVSYYGFSMI